jgi:cell division septal protein FtsQ
MASRKKRSSARRFRLNLPWLWVWSLALVGVLGAGIYTSKLFQIRVVRVEGAQPWDEPRIRKLIQSLQGKPALQIQALAVEQQVEWEPAVLRSEFRRNLFGRARLVLWYRTPLVWYVDARGTRRALARDGTAFELRGDPPRLELDRKLVEGGSNLSIFSERRLGSVLELAEKMQKWLPQQQGKLTILSSGGLSFKAAEGAEVEFGDRDRLDEKVEALRRSLEAEPDLLQRARSVNLVVPDRPAVRWKN